MPKATKGFLAVFTSSALYGLYGIYSRLIAEGFDSFSQGWARGFIVSLFLGIFLIISPRSRKSFKRSTLKWLIPWSLLSPAYVLLSYTAFINLPVGTVYFLVYSTMIIGGFLSGKLFFKEKIKLPKILSLILIGTAIHLIYSYNSIQSHSIYVLMALGAGLSIGFWNTLSKKISHYYSTFQLAFMDAFVCFAVCLVLGILTQEPLPTFSNPTPWLWMVAFSLTTIATVNLLIFGFRFIEAQLGTIIMPLQIVFGAFFGYLFLKEEANLTTILGGLLIFFAAIIPNLYQKLSSKNSKNQSFSYFRKQSISSSK